MNKLGRNLILNGLTAITIARADLRPTDIDPTGQHILAWPAL
jgi:hypothetical protein